MAISTTGTINFKTLSQLAGLKKLVDGIESVITTTAEFQAQMSAVAAVSNATGAELDALAVRARELGATTVLTATQAGKGMEELSRLGFDVNEIFLAVQGTLNLAVSSALGLGRASQIAAGGVRAFNLGADQLNRVVDVLANTAADTGATVDNIGESLSTAGAIADTAGLSFEEFSAFIGVLGDRLIRGSQAGTNFRQFIVGLSTEVPKGKAALEELGLTYDDVNVSTNGLLKVLQNLEVAFDRVGSRQERISLAADLWGRRQFNAALVAIDSVEKFEKLIDVYKRGGDAAQRMADTMQDNLAGSFKLAQSAAQEMALTMGSELSPNLRALLGDFTDTARAAADSGESLKNTGKILGAIITSLGIFVKGLNLAARTIRAVFETIIITIETGLLRAQQAANVFADFLSDMGLQDAAEAIRGDTELWQKRLDEFNDNMEGNLDRMAGLTLSIQDDFGRLTDTFKEETDKIKTVDLEGVSFTIQKGLIAIKDVISIGTIDVRREVNALTKALDIGEALKDVNIEDLTKEQTEGLKVQLDQLIVVFKVKGIELDSSIVEFRQSLEGVAQAIEEGADKAKTGAGSLNTALTGIVTLVTSSGDKIKAKGKEISTALDNILGFSEEEMLRKAATLEGVLKSISESKITLDFEQRETLREQINSVVEDFRKLKRNVPPLVEESARSFNIYVAKFDEVAGAASSASSSVNEAANSMTESMQSTEASADSMGTSFQDASDRIGDSATKTIQVIKEIDKVTGETSTKFVQSATEIGEGGAKMGTGLSQASKGSDELKGTQEGLSTSVGRTRVEINQMATAASMARDNLKSAAESSRALADSGSGLESSMDSSEKKVASLSERAGEAGIKLRDLGKMIVSPKVDSKSILEYLSNVELALLKTAELEAKA